MEFTKIPLDSIREPSAEEMAQERELINRLEGWEHVDAAVLDLFGVIAKYALWDSADACAALFRITVAALPDWVSQNREKILSGFYAAPAEESERASTQQNLFQGL